MLLALKASRPDPRSADELMLFGQFVGSWDVDVVKTKLDGSAGNDHTQSESMGKIAEPCIRAGRS
jgi:hypothetical protein